MLVDIYVQKLNRKLYTTENDHGGCCCVDRLIFEYHRKFNLIENENRRYDWLIPVLLFLVEFLGEEYQDGFLYDPAKHIFNKKYTLDQERPKRGRGSVDIFHLICVLSTLFAFSPPYLLLYTFVQFCPLLCTSGKN